MEQTPPPVPGAPKTNWWKRNWKWFVPLGCLSMAILFVIFVTSIVLIVFSAVKSTDVYKDAFARAKAHPAVIEALGSPITEGFLVSGNTNVNGASGEAKPLHSRLWSERKRNNLRSGNEVAWAVELFRTCLGNCKHASTDRSSQKLETGKSTLISPLASRDKKLSVSAILLGILGGIIGLGPGYFSASHWARLSRPRFISQPLKATPAILPLQSRFS